MIHTEEPKSTENEELLRDMSEIIAASSIPLSHRDISLRLRHKTKRIPDYEVIRNLRRLLQEGRVSFIDGRWCEHHATDTEMPPAPSNIRDLLPDISPESMVRLGLRQYDPLKIPTDGDIKESGFEWEQTSPEDAGDQLQTETWETFRKLVSYYRQCIRNEEGADASAFQNEHGQKFIYLRKVGPWYPKPGLIWRSCLTLGPHFSALLNAISHSADDQSLVVGYPVQAFYKKKDGEPDIAIIRPIFTFGVEHRISRDGLMVSSDNPKAEINLGWL